MCGPLRGAVIGGLLHEGRATNAEDATRARRLGRRPLRPLPPPRRGRPDGGPRHAVDAGLHRRGPGRRAGRHADLLHAERGPREGPPLRRVLRRGARAARASCATSWRPSSPRPSRSAARSTCKHLMAQALQMGDEGHNRNRAGTSLLFRELAPAIVRATARPREGGARPRVRERQRPLLPQPLDADGEVHAEGGRGRAALLARHRHGPQRDRLRHPARVDAGPVVHRTGADGARALLPGLHRGRREPRHRRQRHHGDGRLRRLRHGRGSRRSSSSSAGRAEDALATTRAMGRITARRQPGFAIPALGFAGTPTGIDVRLVEERNLLPARSTPASPTGIPASGRWAPASSTRPGRRSTPPSRRSQNTFGRGGVAAGV